MDMNGRRHIVRIDNTDKHNVMI